MTPLSDLCREKINAAFPPETRDEAAMLLETRCGANLPKIADTDDVVCFDRIRCAVIKLSEGDLGLLAFWVKEAGKDWRVVLDDAGFGHNGEVHRLWTPHRAA